MRSVILSHYLQHNSHTPSLLQMYQAICFKTSSHNGFWQNIKKKKTSIPFITAGGYYDSICDIYIYKHLYNLACTQSENVFMLNIAPDH